MAPARSRFLNDLYMLYIAAILWFVVPVYGMGFAVILPSDVKEFGFGLDILGAFAGLGAFFWGARGGPFALSRSTIVHELGSPVSRTKLLWPPLARQTLFAGALAAVAGVLALAINGGVDDGLAAPARVSAVCLGTAAATVLQAAAWLVVVRGHAGPRRILAAATAAASIATGLFVATGGSLSSDLGLAVLGAVALLSGCISVYGLKWVPIDVLWGQAAALEAMRSSMQTFDFHRIVLDLRRASGPRQPGRIRLARDWMPTALWRQFAALQSDAAGTLARVFVAGAALSALVGFADARQGLTLLAIAGCAGFIGLELSGSLAATADQRGFVVHYPRGSAVVLRAQLATMVALTLAVGLLVVGWQLPMQPADASLALALCGLGSLGAGVLARLGSPDLGRIVGTFGISAVGPLLWARAMFGPAVLLVGTVGLAHHAWHRAGEDSPVWAALVAGVAIVASIVAAHPLERTPDD